MDTISFIKNKNSSSSVKVFDGYLLYYRKLDKLNHWDSYIDNKSKISFFILGRPVIETTEWKNFKKQNSFITKILLKKYLEKKSLDQFCKDLNGGFTLVIIDYNIKSIIIIRDKMGIYPLYITDVENYNDFQFSTHQDILAKYLKNIEIDDVSIAEFLSQGFVMHPNTHYKKIKSLDNASYLIYDYGNKVIRTKKYYHFNKKYNCNYKQLLEKLKDAIINSIDRRTVNELGKTAVLLSGGGDSRVIVCSSHNVEAITTYDVENYEIYITKKICEKLSIKHNLIKRDKDCHRDGLLNAPKYTGAMSIGSSGTMLNLLNNSEIKKFDNILSGDYADWLFKDISFNTEKIKIFGKKLPINKFTKFDFNFYGPNISIGYIKNIFYNRYKVKCLTKNCSNQLQFERIFPLSNEFTNSNRLFFQRELPWDTIFSDNDILDLVCSIPPKYKLNGVLYLNSLKILCKKTKSIANANTHMRLGSKGFVFVIFQIFLSMKQKLKILFQFDNIYGENSWGNQKLKILNDNKLITDYKCLPEYYKNYIINILGFDVFNYNLKELIKSNYHLFYHILTVYYWIRFNNLEFYFMEKYKNKKFEKNIYN